MPSTVSDHVSLGRAADVNTVTVSIKTSVLAVAFILPNVAMSRGYGWRGGCPAAVVPDVGVGSVEWFGGLGLSKGLSKRESKYLSDFAADLDSTVSRHFSKATAKLCL